MRIKFTQAHIGRETDMTLRSLNDTVDIDTAKGLELIRLGFAQQATRVIVPEPIEEPIEQPIIAKVTRTRKVANG